MDDDAAGVALTIEETRIYLVEGSNALEFLYRQLVNAPKQNFEEPESEP